MRNDTSQYQAVVPLGVHTDTPGGTRSYLNFFSYDLKTLAAKIKNDISQIKIPCQNIISNPW